MASYLLKGPDEQFDRWRVAAGDRGLTLAAFLRLAADMAAAKDPGRVAYTGGTGQFSELLRRNEGYPPRVEDPAGSFRPAAPTADELLARVPERAFRPDPRPVSTRKKTR